MASEHLNGLGEECVGLEELPAGAETKASCEVWLEGETPTSFFIFSRPWLMAR